MIFFKINSIFHKQTHSLKYRNIVLTDHFLNLFLFCFIYFFTIEIEKPTCDMKTSAFTLISGTLHSSLTNAPSWYGSVHVNLYCFFLTIY